MTTEPKDDYFEIVVDENFLGNCLTAVMWDEGTLEQNEYLSVEYIERDEDKFVIIAKRMTQHVN